MEKFKMGYIYSPEEKLEALGVGEWVEEADFVEFSYKEYECKILRNSLHGGNLCGYVRIPSRHPYYQKKYEDMEVDCHGGLTFGECGYGHWIGFDCAHSGDIMPYIDKLFKADPELKKIRENHLARLQEMELKYKCSMNVPTYKNIDFCIEECKSIVDQLRQKNE